jgi:protein-disulfide isomerase
LVKYVRHKYALPPSISLSVATDHALDGSCYRELTFEGKSPVKTWRLVMYLSPDRRFLTSDLLDTTVDPVEEGRRNDAATLSGIEANKGTTIGPLDAPVTVVVFSDFECPYCRGFAAIMKEVLATDGSWIRVIFHHFPLSLHPWARAAAEGAACAQIQGPAAFWTIHDRLFTGQGQITSDNIKQKLVGYAREGKAVEMHDFQDCLESGASLGLVFRDMDLASALGVEGTPTVFINGQKAAPITDAYQLHAMLAAARTAAATRVAGSRVLGVSLTPASPHN